MRWVEPHGRFEAVAFAAGIGFAADGQERHGHLGAFPQVAAQGHQQAIGGQEEAPDLDQVGQHRLWGAGRLERSISSTTSAAPTVMALSARLKAGQCQARR